MVYVQLILPNKDLNRENVLSIFNANMNIRKQLSHSATHRKDFSVIHL